MIKVEIIVVVGLRKRRNACVRLCLKASVTGSPGWMLAS